MEDVKFTEKQIKKALDFLSEKQKRSKNESAKLLYNLSTPNKLYVRYVDYRVSNDNGIWSDLVVLCIDKEGETSDCYDGLSGLKEKVTFDKDFIEISIDENRNLKLI